MIHAHDLNTLPVAVALSHRIGSRLVYDAHELYPEVSTLSRRERRVWSAIEKRLIRLADARLTVCRSIAEELAARYHIDEPVVLLNCPPRPRQVARSPRSLRERAGVEAEEPIVLYQGGFAPHRGLEELVRAVPLLEHGVLVLMGWGRLEPTLRDLVDTLQLGHRVRFLPAVAPDELLLVTRTADVGVIPYKPVGLNNRFTTPNKLFEYILAGIPIVGSRLPELVRFIEGNGLGITFEPGDERDLGMALNFVLSDPALLDLMGAGARAARDRFTWEHEAPTLLKQYGRVLGRVDRDPSGRARR